MFQKLTQLWNKAENISFVSSLLLLVARSKGCWSFIAHHYLEHGSSRPVPILNSIWIFRSQENILQGLWRALTRYRARQCAFHSIIVVLYLLLTWQFIWKIAPLVLVFGVQRGLCGEREGKEAVDRKPAPRFGPECTMGSQSHFQRTYTSLPIENSTVDVFFAAFFLIYEWPAPTVITGKVLW